MGRTLLEYTTSLEDWILLEHRIARFDYKETADIFTCCVAVLHAVKMQISVLFIYSILLLQGQTSLDGRNLLEDRVTV